MPVAGSTIDTNGLSASTPSGTSNRLRLATSLHVVASAIPSGRPKRVRNTSSTARTMNSTAG